MRRALLAFGSESASKGTRLSAANRGYVVAAALPHLAEAYALGGPMKDRLQRWRIPMVLAGMKGHLIGPMKPDLAQAVRPLSAAEQLAAPVLGQPVPSLHIGSANLKSHM